MKRSICAIAMVALTAVAAVAAAQDFPSKPIRVVITYAPGGSTDVVGRALAAKMTEGLGQQMVVDNRGGAGGIIGTDIVAHAAPDGYTLLLGTSAGMSINPLLHKTLPYDVQRDFAPISLVVVNPQALVAYPKLPASNVRELIKLAKEKPGTINYASPGVGSPNHMGMELLKSMTGISLVHVPYKGGGPAMADLMGGQVQLLFNSLPGVIPHLKSGRLKVLAIGSGHRSPALPDVPTVAESGVPGYEYATWYGLFAPARTAKPAVARLNKAVNEALGAGELSRWLASQGSEARPTSPEELAQFVKAEHQRWSRVVKAAGLTAH